MKNILVTGGAGFIGSNFVRYILQNSSDLKVVILDLLTYAGNLMNLEGIDESRHTFVKGDIRDQALVEELFSKYQFEYVVNFAAESHVDRSIKNPNIFVETNVLGTAVLLAAARKYDVSGNLRFLQVSTDEVYGTLPEDKPEIMFTENTPLDPHSPYSASKAGADHLVQSYHDTFGMHTLITRCSNNYGPYQFPEKLIPLMINNARNDKELPVYGDGKNIRDWLFVEDHCSAIYQVMVNGNKGEVYNIGGNNEIKNIDIVKTILKILDKPESLIKYVKDRLGHDRRYAIDASKIEKELGWKPTVSPQKGIEMTIKWYIDNQKWLDNVISGDYKKYYNEMYGD